MSICGVLPGRKDVQFYAAESCECLRPINHRGEHVLYVKEQDRYVAWETDWECPCDDPHSCEGDWCILYGEISKEEAEKMIAFAEYETKK